MDSASAAPLRALDPAEAALVAAHPLPPGTPDAVVSKAQLEIGLGVSQTTLAVWQRKGLPFEEAGTNGRSYRFRLSVAYAWAAAMRAGEDRARADGDAAVEQLQLALLGGEAATGAAGAARMTLADQKRVLELEYQRTLAARARGELLRREDVVMAFEEVFAAVRDAMDALPDRLAREFGLEGRDLERAETICDDVFSGAGRAVLEVIGDGGDDT